MGRSSTLILAALLSVLIGSPAGAYYHFIHYTGRNSPWGPVPEKFDLNALPNKTVTFFVSDTGPALYPQNDSFPSVLSQIRQAAQAWNGVGTSDLRIAFGGLFAANTSQTTAGGQVIFEDLPPGVLGYGGPSRPDGIGAVTTNSNGTFVPITLSLVHLTRDLTQQPGPSYSEAFFLTATHEMGHALGLQHTFTSSTMSTAVTRGTSLSHPLDVDDVAAISILYPTKAFAAQTGGITGQITANGQGVHLASVVAIRSGAPAVSALSNPDGSYHIDGIPPGQYLVYAHPLPPTANIILPVDPDGRTIAASGPFDTTFYPGTKDFSQASSIAVTAGGVSDAGNLSVRPRASIPIYDISLYSYLNQNTIAVKPAFLSVSSSTPATVVAQGTGIGPGLSAQLMGGGASVYATTLYPANGASALAIYVRFSLGTPPGIQHLVISQPDFVYVLPSCVKLTERPPPSLATVTNNGDGSATITGANFASDSQIYFDGLPTAIRSLDTVNGTAVVIPPPGASAQNATVTLFNTDGQNSMFLQSGAPPTFAFDASAPASIALNPGSLPAGSEALIDITGVNTKFTAAQTIVGFGSSDVYVRRTFVLSPTHLIADVSIPANASLTATEATAVSGFQVASQPLGFQILPQIARLPQPVPVLMNAIAGQTGAYANAIVSLFGVNLAAPGGTPAVTFNDRPATILSATSGQINLQIPAGLSTGPAVMKLNNGSDNSFPVEVSIDPPPPVITAVQDAGGTNIDSTNSVRAGDVVMVLLSGFADPGAAIDTSRVRINLGGVDLQALTVSPGPASNLFAVQFAVTKAVPPGAQVPLIVYLDGRSSTQAAVPILKPAGADSDN